MALIMLAIVVLMVLWIRNLHGGNEGSEMDVKRWKKM